MNFNIQVYARTDESAFRYLDYFCCLNQYIESKLQTELPSAWSDARIEFIFSVPTTWKPHPTVERFRYITQRAGFGNLPNHKSSIGLTEAEAAAVHMSQESPAIFKACYQNRNTWHLYWLLYLGKRHSSSLWCRWRNNGMRLYSSSIIRKSWNHDAGSVSIASYRYRYRRILKLGAAWCGIW